MDPMGTWLHDIGKDSTALGFGDMSHHKPSILLRFDLHTNVDTVSTIEHWHPTGNQNHNTWFSYIR